MGTVNSDASPGVTADQPTAADALRAAADWLDEHPAETVRWGSLSLQVDSREDLERVADALGRTVIERADAYKVSIERSFGKFNVHADCYWAQLGVEAKLTAPDYDPILGVRA